MIKLLIISKSLNFQIYSFKNAVYAVVICSSYLEDLLTQHLHSQMMFYR